MDRRRRKWLNTDSGIYHGYRVENGTESAMSMGSTIGMGTTMGTESAMGMGSNIGMGITIGTESAMGMGSTIGMGSTMGMGFTMASTESRNAKGASDPMPANMCQA